MGRKGIVPDIVACGTIIFSLCNNGKIDIAYELMMGMLKKGIETESQYI